MMEHTFGVRTDKEEFICTNCSQKITIGFGNVRGPFGIIIGEDECLCTKCSEERGVPEFILTSKFINVSSSNS